MISTLNVQFRLESEKIKLKPKTIAFHLTLTGKELVLPFEGRLIKMTMLCKIFINVN